MATIRDQTIRISGGTIKVYGITRMLKDAEAVGVAATDLKNLTWKLGQPIAARAKALAPKRTGRLAAGIRPVKSKRKVQVRVGSKSRLPYAGVNHWGLPGSRGPQWLTRAEKELRLQTFDGFAEGIKDLLKKHNWQG